MSITLINATDDTLTVSWPETPAAKRYVLQFRKASSSSGYETLSDKLTTAQARKRNLSDDTGEGFYFRAGALLNDGDETPASWVTHEEAFRLLTTEAEASRMSPPNVSLGGSNESLLVAWQAKHGATGYELQMRENTCGEQWKTIAAKLSSTEVRKKNLHAKNGYQFRVRPLLDGSDVVFSSPSDPVVALGLSSGLKQLFRSLEKGTLLKRANEPPIPLADALGGKEFVLLYASAHWCGPCRQFTPMLSQWYNSLGPNRTVEVVFLSADHDERGFAQYYSSMPWLAVDFDEDTREELMGFIRVSGIPRLAVLDGRTGRIIEDNAVGKPLDVNRWRSLVKK